MKFGPVFSWLHCKKYLKSQYNFFSRIFVTVFLARYSTLFSMHASNIMRDITLHNECLWDCLFCSIKQLTLIDWDRGKQHVLWARDCRCFPRRSRRKHRKSRVYKTYCFPEVSVNKYLIIYQESKKRKNKANFIRKYMKYFINFLKNVKFNAVHNVIHKTFAVFGCLEVAFSRDGARDFFCYSPLIMHCLPRALMRGRQSNFVNLTWYALHQ